MDPHRNSFPDESEPRWYRGEQQPYAEPGYRGEQQPYPEPAAHARFETHVDDTGYRAQERRGAGRMPPGPQPGMGQPAAPWGPDAPPMPTSAPPPLPPTETPPRDPLLQRDPSNVSRDTARGMGRQFAPALVSTGTQPGRRTLVGVLIVIGLGALALPVVRVLFAGAFGPTVSAGGVISSVLVLFGLPLAARGLYGLATGAASMPDVAGPRAWLRPPVAYLIVALVLFVAAGLAAS